jgi:2-polyprenyl-6-methoxyphenol hydroxylase-like FAD-dependent oxidoreductase
MDFATARGSQPMGNSLKSMGEFMNLPDTQIFIAGAGPVGMTLALELAHHGIKSVIVERNPTTTRHPKMDLTNGRSMELFRRLGIADKLRSVGVAPSESLDIVWATKATGHVLHRFAYPSPDARRDMERVKNDGSGTLEPSMRVSQIILEPVLKAEIDASPLVDVRFGWAYESFVQDDDGVTATICNSESGEKETVRADYLVGCDGGGSRVRQDAGITSNGEYAIANAYMIHFRSTDLSALGKFGVAYHLQTSLGTLVAQNGKDIFTLQSVLPPGTEVDPDELLQRFVGRNFDYEILVANPWTPHMVLADSYRNGRVFIAGDAAHQVIPTGGYGMNTGIGDAVDLGWKLAAVINGWAGDELLESFDAERRPIGEQNRAAAMRHMHVRMAILEVFQNLEGLGDPETAEAAPWRIEAGRQIGELGNAENESWGIEHGFRYTESPVICAGPQIPAFDPMACSSVAVIGGRVPSYYLADGTPLHDLLASDSLSLVAIGSPDAGNIASAAADLGIPVKHVQLDQEAVLDRLGSQLILVRPDQHIAWLGDKAPPQWAPVLNKVTGRDPS